MLPYIFQQLPDKSVIAAIVIVLLEFVLNTAKDFCNFRDQSL